MFARLIEGFRRRRMERRIRRGRQEFNAVADVAAYYGEQVDRLNVEIDVRHAELMALVMQRDTMMTRRDGYDLTVAQLEAQYRSA